MKRIFLFFILLLVGCDQSRYSTFSGFEQGTTYVIVVRDAQDGLQDRIDAKFDEIDLTFSIFNPQSLTSRINRNETDATTPLLDECFKLAKEVWEKTNGYYDPTVKPLVDAWGFGPEEEQAEPCVECLMEYVGFDKVQLERGRIVKTDPRVQLDFSSIAKGFTVDKLADMLEAEGVTDYMVEIGGEVRALGVNAAGRTWRIQIDKPIAGLTHEREAIIVLTSGAVATSGNYRNWFVDEQGRTRVHTIDPKTGKPAAGEILSVSINATSCAVADAWATGVMASQTLENTRRLLTDRGTEIDYYIIYGSEDATKPFYNLAFPVVEK